MKLRIRTIAMSIAAALLVLIASVAATPAADAQYAPGDPAPFDCTQLGDPTVSFDGTDVVVTFPTQTLFCVLRVDVEAGSVLFSGPPPTTGALRVSAPSLTGGDVVSVKLLNFRDDVLGSASAAMSPETLAFVEVGDVAIGDDGDDGDAEASSADTTTATATSTSTSALAFTGSNSLPVLIGLVLLGSGSLLTIAARTRRNDEFDASEF